MLLDCEAGVQYRILGSIEVWADGRPIAIGAGKQRALLAVLLMDANRMVSVDRLIDALWGERPPASGAKFVQVLISQLRKAFAVDGERIVTVGGGYLLRVAAGETDADQFEELLEMGRRELAGGNPRAAHRTLSAALDLWRGSAYEDVAYDDFARDEIARLEQRRLDAIEERFEALLADGRHADAVSGLEKLVAEHPLRERLVALWMVALHRCGRRAEALAAYDAARKRLAGELGIEPGERLQRLYAAMLEPVEADRRPLELLAPRRRRSARLLLAGGGTLFIAAAVAALMVSRSHTTGGIDVVAGDHVALIDPISQRVVAEYPVGQTPSDVVARGDVAWTINADSQTLSRIQRDGTRRDVALPGIPGGVVWNAGWIWVSYIVPTDNSNGYGVAKVDPLRMRVEGRIPLPSGPADAGYGAPIAAAAGRLWVGGPYGKLTEIDPSNGHQRSMALTYQHGSVGARALAVDGDNVWVLYDAGAVQRVDARSGRARGKPIPVATPHVTDIVAGGGLVWVSDLFTGDVFRIDPGPPVMVHTVSVGASASNLSLAGNVLWTSDGVDGTLARIDIAGNTVRRIPVGNTPVGVAVSRVGVWTTVTGGGGAATQTTNANGIPELPTATCGRAIYGAGAKPDLLVAADLPLDRFDTADFTGAMASAMEFDLRLHHFQAGRFNVALQVCDDSTSPNARWSPAMAPKCSANAQIYADAPSVVAVLGPFNSGCTANELPILNRARPGPLAMVSAANSWAGFTRHITGSDPGEPQSHYPTGVRSYLRVYPSDVAEEAADAHLARLLGVRHPLVALAPGADSWSTSVAYSFAGAARAQGLRVVGPLTLTGDVRRTMKRLISRGVDGLFLGGFPATEFLTAARTARRASGPRFPIIAPNFWLLAIPDALRLAPAFQGAYVSGGYFTSPRTQLPAVGSSFMGALGATSGPSTVGLAPYAAQAMNVVLAAIARSDGTRQSVLQQLFRTRVRNDILGSFGFQANGDMTAVPVAIYRVDPNAPKDLRPFTVLTTSPG